MKVNILNIKGRCNLGIYDWENVSDVLVSIQIDIPKLKTYDINTIVNYDTITDKIYDILSSKPFDFIENLVIEIGEKIMDFNNVQSCHVKVQKCIMMSKVSELSAEMSFNK